MEKQYEVNYSYTIDYISWTCPRCEEFNESGEDDCTVCKNCGFERETSSLYELGQTDAKSEVYYYEEN